MDENATCCGSRPRPRPHCVKRGLSSLRKGHSTAPPPSFRPMSVVATVARLSYCMLSSCCSLCMSLSPIINPSLTSGQCHPILEESVISPLFSTSYLIPTNLSTVNIIPAKQPSYSRSSHQCNSIRKGSPIILPVFSTYQPPLIQHLFLVRYPWLCSQLVQVVSLLVKLLSCSSCVRYETQVGLRVSVVYWLWRWTRHSTVAGSIPGRCDKYWDGWPSLGEQRNFGPLQILLLCISDSFVGRCTRRYL